METTTKKKKPNQKDIRSKGWKLNAQQRRSRCHNEAFQLPPPQV
jgi:hypothetical protein